MCAETDTRHRTVTLNNKYTLNTYTLPQPCLDLALSVCVCMCVCGVSVVCFLAAVRLWRQAKKEFLMIHCIFSRVCERIHVCISLLLCSPLPIIHLLTTDPLPAVYNNSANNCYLLQCKQYSYLWCKHSCIPLSVSNKTHPAGVSLGV